MTRAEYEQWFVDRNSVLLREGALDDRVAEWLCDNGLVRGYVEWTLIPQLDCIIVEWCNDTNRAPVRIPLVEVTDPC